MPLVSSNFLTILESFQAEILSLNLTFNANPVAVEVKKISQWLQGLSLPALPIILIAPQPDKPPLAEPWTFENEVLVKYPCAVVVVAAGNRDNTFHQDVWLNWDEEVRRLFQWGLQEAGTPLDNAFFDQLDLDPPLSREAYLKNYDVSGLGFLIWNVEQRRNGQPTP